MKGPCLNASPQSCRFPPSPELRGARPPRALP